MADKVSPMCPGKSVTHVPGLDLARPSLSPSPCPDRRLACAGRDGNVWLKELLTIATLVAARQPRRMLEIGTFDGNAAVDCSHPA